MLSSLRCRQALSDFSSHRRTRQIEDAFQELGIPTSTQRYTYELSSNSVCLLPFLSPFAAAHFLPSQTVSGINTYAILAAPKTDGAEALVLSASWLSRAVDENGQPRINTRGVAIVLALANYFKSMSASFESK